MPKLTAGREILRTKKSHQENFLKIYTLKSIQIQTIFLLLKLQICFLLYYICRHENKQEQKQDILVLMLKVLYFLVHEFLPHAIKKKKHVSL